MSLKSLVQVVILIIIFVILGGVYFKYFSKDKIVIEENIEKNIENIETNKIVEKENNNLAANNEQNLKIDENKGEVKVNKDNNNLKNEQPSEENQKNKNEKKTEVKNLVKDIEYLTTDKKGNRYKIVATSGRTNSEDKNVLDLDNVSGEISSAIRSTIYIVSDFAEYNSSNLNSKFFNNVIINYEDKEIVCDNFDINMETNIAIAYNNVVVTDPKSIMKAGKITLNMDTKEIDINPDSSSKSKVTINTTQ